MPTAGAAMTEQDNRAPAAWQVSRLFVATMPRLYIEEYTRALSGKTVCVACREGILRDHFEKVIADIKFLNRQGIRTRFYHNIPNRFANQKYFKILEDRLPETRIVRVAPDMDF